ncbi:MAG: TIM barrel protein [Pseudomonadota bacterium]
MRFSANLGFLWSDRPLPAAIRAAKDAGFAAVECHWPYDVEAGEVRAALNETGLPMLGLNTRRGDVAAGENGLSALPGRVGDARAAIEEAVVYGSEIEAQAVHIMAGFAHGREARDTFIDNLRFAAAYAGQAGMVLLLEPLNRHDAPGYFLQTTDQAARIIDDVAAPNVKLMFDCYHVGRTEGDLITRFEALLPIIGHVQFAGVPSRGTPDQGEVSYDAVFQAFTALGWNKPLGAEYKPTGPTDASLDWMARYRSSE